MRGMDKRRLMGWIAALCFLLLVAVGLICWLQPKPTEPEDATPVFAASGSLFSLELLEPTPGDSTPSSAPSATPSATPLEPAASPAPPEGFSITVVSPGTQPVRKRVLIYHTHTYEAYTPDADTAYEETEAWRTADARYNVVRVGEELAALLTSLGFDVTHDTAAYEPPDLTGSYARSLQMLLARQAAGERYDLYVDLHRDAYIENQTNHVTVGDTRVARLMLLIGKGEGQTSEGFDQRPEWETNLALAQRMTDALNAQQSGLCKAVRTKSGRFNQHVAPCCVLVEAGNNRNTLAEALAAMPYLADAIRDALAP